MNREDRLAEIEQMLRKGGVDWLNLLKACGGYYKCPRDAKTGKRLGPLVAYAGRDEQGRQFVGDVYANFAHIERIGPALAHVAEALLTNLNTTTSIGRVSGFCGAPEGGKALATVLSVIDRNQYIFPDKKVTALAVKSSREKSELVFGRHEPAKGERWIIVEDICNNFSTTADLVNQIEQHGAQCVGIVCFLDRSEKNDGRFSFNSSDGSRVTIPVISLVRMFIPQYQQDDPEVLADVRTGNVIWKPKIEWDRLAKAMAQVA